MEKHLCRRGERRLEDRGDHEEVVRVGNILLYVEYGGQRAYTRVDFDVALLVPRGLEIGNRTSSIAALE